MSKTKMTFVKSTKITILNLFLIVTPSIYADSEAIEQLADHPMTLKRVEAYCLQEYKNESKLITTCMNSQMYSLRQIEGYQIKRYPNINEEHPVSRILKDSMNKASVVVDNKPWVNWNLAKLELGLQNCFQNRN